VTHTSTSLRWYTAVTACIAGFGVFLQGYLSLKLATLNGQTIGQGLSAFLGYFTVLTNILVCLALLLPAIARASVPGRFFASPFAVAGIAANIAFVAVSYHFLLRNVWNPRGAQLLADVLLHYVIPALFIVYWFVYFRTGSLRWVSALLWSIYPTVYFVYVLVRGAFVGTYPYGFIDAGAIGYHRTTINAFGLLFGFIVLGLFFVGLDRVGRRWTRLGSAE
jgi:hypothetical protein